MCVLCRPFAILASCHAHFPLPHWMPLSMPYPCLFESRLVPHFDRWTCFRVQLHIWMVGGGWYDIKKIHTNTHTHTIGHNSIFAMPTTVKRTCGGALFHSAFVYVSNFDIIRCRCVRFRRLCVLFFSSLVLFRSASCVRFASDVFGFSEYIE